MNALLLSSLGGGSNNLLPLILPIWIVIAIVYLVDLLVRFIKRRKHRNDQEQWHEKSIIDLMTPAEGTDQNQG
jgi:hypothetical protein